MENKCILCNVYFKGFGHNPKPLESSDHQCCSVCNETRVIPYRLYQILKS